MASSSTQSLDEELLSRVNAALLLLPDIGGSGPFFTEAASPTAEDESGGNMGDQDGSNNVVLGGPVAAAAFMGSFALEVAGTGEQNSIQNDVTIADSSVGNFVRIGIGNAATTSSPLGLIGNWAADLPAGTGAAICNLAGVESSPSWGETLTFNVSDSGNNDGNYNQIVIGSANSGNFDGNDNLVAIENVNGVSVSATSTTGLLAGDFALTTGQGSAADIVCGGLANFLATSVFSSEPVGYKPVVPTINLVFESIQITVTDTGNNDGDNNTVTLGSDNSGSHNGNRNKIDVGNGNGVSISALNPKGINLLTEQVQLNVTGSGDSDGNSNGIAIGSWNGASDNGNNNAVLIGNDNGVGVSIGEDSNRLTGGFEGNSLTSGTQTLTNLGTYLDQSFAVPVDVLSNAVNYSVSGAGDGYNGSFNGNANTVAIGNDNGASIDVALGNFFPDTGRDFVSESVLITVLNSGNNDGSSNGVLIGSGNGASPSGGALSNFLSPNASIAAAGAAALGSSELPSWSELNEVIGMLPYAADPVTLVFESVGISVVNSGNNDGTQNAVLVGSQNGGSHNGDNNHVLIGNDNGVVVHV